MSVFIRYTGINYKTIVVRERVTIMERVDLSWLIPDTPNFVAVLNSEEHIKCQMLKYGQNEIYVDTPKGKLLIPERSIQYYILEESE